MKLLYVTTVVKMVEAFLLPYARHYRARGWRVDAIANGLSDSELAAEAFDQCWEIEWARNPLDPRNFLSAPHALRSLVTRERYDIVHVHSPVAAFVTRFALRSLPRDVRPVVIYSAHGFHFHPGGAPTRNTVFQALEKLAGRWTDWLVTVNRADTEAARRLELVPEDRHVFIPGFGIDRTVFDSKETDGEAAATVRCELGIPMEAPLLLSVAAYHPRKRPLDVIEAFARSGDPAAHLVMVGWGELDSQMAECADSLGVAERVHITGFRHDVQVWMRTADAVILASEHEGRPQSVMEAMCLSTPVLGSDIRGTQDLLERGGGILFPPGDVDALAEAMRWVVEHPVEAAEMGKEASRYVEDYELPYILCLHDDLYKAALATRYETSSLSSSIDSTMTH